MKYVHSTLLIILLCLSSQTGFSQAPPLFSWQKCLGGTAIDASQKIITCANNDLLVVGNTQSANGDVQLNRGSRDYWMVRMNQAGQIVWEKTYGGTGSDIATSVVELADGKIIVCGYTSSNNGDVTGNHGNFDAWIVKTDGAGNKLWQRALGGTNNDFAESIAPTSDGGFIIGGSSYSNNGNVSGNHGDQDFWIIKTDSLGVIQWQKSIGGSAFDQCFSIAVLKDGTYLAAGVSASNNGNVSGNNGGNDLMAVRLTAGGAILWTSLFGGSSFESAFHCIQNTAGNIVITGYTNSSDSDVTYNRGSSDIWLLELGLSGNMLNSKTFGGTNSDIGYSILQNAAGYLIASSTFSLNMDIPSNHGGEDILLIQTDLNGNKIWTKTYGGSADDHPASLIGNYDVGFKVAGYTNSNNGDVNGNHGNSDVWICNLSCIAPSMAFVNPVDSMCVYTSAAFTSTSSNVSQYTWKINGANISTAQNISYTFNSTGNYLVELIGNTCLMTDSFSETMLVSPVPVPVITTSGNLICNDDSVMLESSLAGSYTWSNGATTQSVWIGTSGTYQVTANVAGCPGSSAPVSIASHTIPTFSFGNDTAICSGSNFWITAPAGYVSYTWQDGSPYQSFIATQPGLYSVIVSDGTCAFTESIVVDTLNCSLPLARFNASRVSVCQNESVDFFDLSLNATSWFWSFPGGTPSTSVLRNPTGIVYDSAGHYDVNLIINNSTGSNANFQQSYIRVSAKPAKPMITASGTILLSSQANAYQWYLDSFPVSGANSSAYTAAQSGNYSVAVISPAGCSSMSAPVYISVTGISAVPSHENFFRVFPNPSSGTIFLEFNNSNTGEVQVEILNIAGQIVYSSEITSNNKTPQAVNLDFLQAGFYMLRAQNASEFSITRFQLIR